MQRVAAVIHRGGDDWSAVVETAEGLMTLEAKRVYDWPLGMRPPRIDKDGVHVELETGPRPKTVDILLGRY